MVGRERDGKYFDRLTRMFVISIAAEGQYARASSHSKRDVVRVLLRLSALAARTSANVFSCVCKQYRARYGHIPGPVGSPARACVCKVCRC